MKRVVARVVIPIVLVVCILFSLPGVCGHGHGHDHGHVHDHAHGHGHAHDHAHGHGHAHGPEEPPSYKWSKQANVQYQDEMGENIETGEANDGEMGTQPDATPIPKPSVWVEALLATLGISIAPYVILFFIPVSNRKEHEPHLKVFLAFASGGLLGDAFLHLIPHALMAKANTDGSHSHSHSHSHGEGTEGHSHDMSIGLSVLGGIIAFLVVEKVVRIIKGGHSHSHSHGQGKVNGEAKKGDKDGEKKKNDKKKSNGGKAGNKKNGEGQIKVAGLLNLAADFTHNFTDGLAIGASFLAGKSVGTVTTLTIFLHEIPHEIGDFAILLQSGCSRKKAMMLQLVTAVGAFAGTCISLLAEGADESAVAWVLPFTAGGFIYIATVSVIPELLENSGLWQSVVEVMALLAGVVLMMAIAHLEETAGHEHL